MKTSWQNTEAGYGWISIAFHWLMLLLIAAVYATMEFKGAFPKGSAERASMASWHYMLGLSVLVLVWLRLGMRLTSVEPPITPASPQWQARLAKLLHIVLYALMICLPLLGWLTLSARGAAIPFFGIELPALVGKSKDLANWFKEVHETTATVGYFLIGAHALAALFHHYIVRDDTLRRMWFRR